MSGHTGSTGLTHAHCEQVACLLLSHTWTPDAIELTCAINQSSSGVRGGCEAFALSLVFAQASSLARCHLAAMVLPIHGGALWFKARFHHVSPSRTWLPYDEMCGVKSCVAIVFVQNLPRSTFSRREQPYRPWLDPTTDCQVLESIGGFSNGSLHVYFTARKAAATQ